MAPDLNSLPPSRISTAAVPRTVSSSGDSPLRAQSPTPSSPRSTSTSLQAAAAVNAGLQHEESRAVRRSSSSTSRTRQPSYSSSRRRSNVNVLMNLQLNDPGLPAPGEMISESQTNSHRTMSPQAALGSPTIPMGDPHHNRNPSLGEIHQELEQEQEAQVNRLLQMIRSQQAHLQQLQAATGQPQNNSTVIEDATPTSERSSMSFPNAAAAAAAAPQTQTQTSTSTPRSPTTVLRPRTSFDMARADLAQRRSRTPSRTASPRLTSSPRIRSTSISGEGEPFNLVGRDDSAFYQAETQMMTRENQMLRQRIRELERQVSELQPHSSITNEPATSSQLNRATSVSEQPSPDPPASATESATEVKNE